MVNSLQKAKHAEVMRKYRLNHPDKILETRRKFVKNNKEKIKEEKKAAYALNPEPAKERARKNYYANHEENKGKLKQWKLENKDLMGQYQAKHAKNNPEKIAINTQKRNAAKLKATPLWANDFFIGEAYSLACARTKMTGMKWHVDHIVPLRSNLVCGLHVQDNLAVIPAYENMRKGNRYWEGQYE